MINLPKTQWSKKLSAIALLMVLLGCSIADNIPKSTPAKSALQRAMSINACADHLLYALADKEQIVSLSHYARDRFTSPIYENVRDIPINHASAEEILKERPDILFQSPVEKPLIGDISKTLNIKTYWFGVPNSAEEAMKLVDIAGAALGQKARATNLNNRIREAIIPAKQRPVRALILFQGGFSAGENTLIDDLMSRAGFHNMARDFNIGNWGKVNSEQIIANPPELLIIATGSANGAPSQKAMNHKAFNAKQLGIKFASFPSQYAYCGGPVIIDLANHLKQIRREYGNG